RSQSFSDPSSLPDSTRAPLGETLTEVTPNEWRIIGTISIFGFSWDQTTVGHRIPAASITANAARCASPLHRLPQALTIRVAPIGALTGRLRCLMNNFLASARAGRILLGAFGRRIGSLLAAHQAIITSLRTRIVSFGLRIALRQFLRPLRPSSVCLRGLRSQYGRQQNNRC